MYTGFCELYFKSNVDQAFMLVCTELNSYILNAPYMIYIITKGIHSFILNANYICKIRIKNECYIFSAYVHISDYYSVRYYSYHTTDVPLTYCLYIIDFIYYIIIHCKYFMKYHLITQYLYLHRIGICITKLI